MMEHVPQLMAISVIKPALEQSIRLTSSCPNHFTIDAIITTFLIYCWKIFYYIKFTMDRFNSTKHQERSFCV